MTPILTISTKPQSRRMVEIDGRAYPLRRASDLAVIRPGARKEFARLSALCRLTQPTPAQTRTRRQLLATLTDVMLDAPPAIRAKLQDEHRLALMTAFVTAEQPRKVR